MGDNENIRRRRVRTNPSDDSEHEDQGNVSPGARPSEMSSPERESTALSTTEDERSVASPTEEEGSVDSPSSRGVSPIIQSGDESEHATDDNADPSTVQEEKTSEKPSDAPAHLASSGRSESPRSDAEMKAAEKSDLRKSPASDTVGSASSRQSSVPPTSASRPLMYAPPWERSPSLMNPVLKPPVPPPIPSGQPQTLSQSPVHGRSPAKTVTSETEGQDKTLSLRQHSHGSSEQDTNSCCTKLAFSVYSKAVDLAARKGLPRPSSSIFKVFRKGDHKEDGFPRSEADYILAIDGLPRGDEEATESSDDYTDIEFRRDSVFRPEIIYLTNAYDKIPPVSENEDDELSGAKKKSKEKGTSPPSSVIPQVVETPSTPETSKSQERPESPFGSTGSGPPSRPVSPEEEAQMKKQVEDTLKGIDRCREALQEAQSTTPKMFEAHRPEPDEQSPPEEEIFIGEKVRFEDQVVKPEFPNVLDFHENYPMDAAHDVDVRKYGGIIEPSETGRSRAVPLSKEASLEEQPPYIKKPPVARERKTIAQSMIQLKDKINVGIKGMLKPHDVKDKKEHPADSAVREMESQPKPGEEAGEAKVPEDTPKASGRKSPEIFAHMKEQIKGVFKPHETSQPIAVPATDTGKAGATDETVSPKPKSGMAHVKEQIKEAFKPHEAKVKKSAEQTTVVVDDTYEIPESPSPPPKEKISFDQMKQQIKEAFKTREFSRERGEVPKDELYEIPAKPSEVTTPTKEKSGFAQMKEQMKEAFKSHEQKEKTAVKSGEGDYDVPVVMDVRELPKDNQHKEKKGLMQNIHALKEKLSFKDGHPEKKTAYSQDVVGKKQEIRKPEPVINYISDSSLGTDLTDDKPRKPRPPRPAPPKRPYQKATVFPYYYRGWNDSGSMSTEDLDDFQESPVGPDATEEPQIDFPSEHHDDGEFFSEPEDLRQTHDPTMYTKDSYRRSSLDHMTRCLGPFPQHPMRPPRNKVPRKGGRIGYPSPKRPFPHELPVLRPSNPELFKPLVAPYSAKHEDTNGVINKLSLSPRLGQRNKNRIGQQIRLSPFATTERPPKNRVVLPGQGQKPKVPPKPKLPKYYPVYILVPGVPLAAQDKQPPPPRPPPPPPRKPMLKSEVGNKQPEVKFKTSESQVPGELQLLPSEQPASDLPVTQEPKPPTPSKEAAPEKESEVQDESSKPALTKEEEEFQRIIEETLRECTKHETDEETVQTDMCEIKTAGEGEGEKLESAAIEPSVVLEQMAAPSDDVKLAVDASAESQPPTTTTEKLVESALPPADDKPPVPTLRRKTSRAPRPPPRVRRSRSKTVEIYPVTEKPEDSRRRSQSLSDDAASKLADRLEVSQQDDIKALYTQVVKPPARTRSKSKLATSQECISRMQERPLPPPPPPPRCRSRSSTHKAPKRTSELLQGGSLDRNFKLNRSNEADYAVPSSQVKPVRPARRSHSQQIGVDENANIALMSVPNQVQEGSEPKVNGVVKRSSSQPKQTKYRNSTFYCDTENGNIPVDKEDMPEVRKPARKKRSWSTGAIDRPDSISPFADRNRTSWYDDDEGSSGTFGDVDTSVNESVHKQLRPDGTLLDRKGRPVPPMLQKRKKSKGESQPKEKRSSKFYFDLQSDSQSRPDSQLISDLEERPPSELADKAVQTVSESETLDRDDRSEDTEELFDLTDNLRNELKQVLARRSQKSETDSKTGSDTFRTASAGAADESQRALVRLREPHRDILHSSTSELSWHELSEVDSGDDLAELEFEDPSEVAERKRKRKAFYIARELMTSEEVFVNALKLLNEDFRNVVQSASEERGSPVIPDDVMNQIFGSLPQLQQLNENLLRELKDRIERWDECQKVADVIVKMGPFLKLYSSYIRDFETITATLEESCRKYPAFAQVVSEFEKSPRCRMLALKTYMLKPVQRIPQYRLLLQDYLRHLTESSPDYRDTKTALNIVCEVAGHANESMKQGDNLSKLVEIQNSIWGRHEIIKPGRVFIKEGELMKLSRSKMQPRRFILFSDCFMYLTPVQYGLYRINHELSLTGMRVSIPVQQDYQNEFSVISVTRSFTLAARSPEERKEWINALNKAIEENASKRSTFTNIRLQQMLGEEGSSHPCILGRQAPVWIPDTRVTMCQVCTSEFTVTFRRHHCRACGKVVCYACSSNKLPLHYLRNRAARVCDECFEVLQEEIESITYASGMRQEFTSETESGENEDAAGSGGQSMAVVKPSHKGNVKATGKRMRRYLPKVLKEVCANDQGSTISGYLMRRTGRRCWKRYWFVIKDKVIYTYKASEDIAALESIPLLGFSVETFTESLDGIDASLVFQLSHPNHPPFIFHAESPGSAERWVKAMKEATVLE